MEELLICSIRGKIRRNFANVRAQEQSHLSHPVQIEISSVPSSSPMGGISMSGTGVDNAVRARHSTRLRDLAPRASPTFFCDTGNLPARPGPDQSL